MNDALQIYENEDKVAGISGFSFIESSESVYFLRMGVCWGWATWKRVWNTVNFDIDYLLSNFNTKEIIKDFNVNGTYPYYKMLNQQKSGLIDSWAVRFYASYFLNQQLFLYPAKTMVSNIGFDEGTHFNSKQKRKEISKTKKKLLSKQEIQKPETIKEDEVQKQKIIKVFQKQKNKNILINLMKKISVRIYKQLNLLKKTIEK
jgi:hypothetical protein